MSRNLIPDVMRQAERTVVRAAAVGELQEDDIIPETKVHITGTLELFGAPVLAIVCLDETLQDLSEPPQVSPPGLRLGVEALLFPWPQHTF